ncbi:hypothetical protein [Cellulosimicrobium arenosum]|uniref:Uncharacterized protein n=1 Tax=Cellulosimicrobium arenosum TaxID=2708133 RepID=A0A927J2P7_9MICO|nr:hypothetical protein [Cellulosimicrobium arenosum]MBD8080685.1 hypothetical protein [Cellulosimicrobium arenosum]
MSDNGSNGQPVRPLTRREIREREQAEAARRAERSDVDGGGPRPPRTPQPAAAPPPSRRSLRETSGATQYPSQPSVVRPPSTSGGMRGLDETGRLTPVQETAERVTIRPPSPPAQPPTRTSSRPVRAPGASGPTPAPGASAPTRAPGSSGVTRAPGSSGVTRAPGASGPVRPPTPVRGGAPVARVSTRGAGVQGMFDHAAGLGAPAPTSTPARPAAEPAVETAGPQRESTSTPERRPATAQPSSDQRTASAPAAALPWSAITAGGAPERATSPTQAPLGHVGDSAGSPAPDDLFPRVHADRGSRAAEAPDDDDPTDARGPSYTWLHYLILVAVAFVLGLLVWELISSDDAGSSTAGVHVIVDQVADATPGTSGTGR